MKVKKYIVDSLPQAMGQIKTDLGQDAMILHTKKIKTGGFLGLFRKERIEVIAAIDSTPSRAPASGYPSYTNNVKPKTATNTSSYNSYANSYINKDKPTQDRAENMAVKPDLNYPMQEVPAQNTSDVNEIKQLMIKMMMNQAEGAGQAGKSGYQADIKSVYNRLIKQGVKEEIATLIIEDIIKVTDNNSVQVDVFEVAKNQIIKRFKNSCSYKEINQETQIVHFVGATGVGKTTTIAKLAAEKVLKHKKRIAFITADTYRIGAVDQLRTYAEILHSPIEVVFSPQDTQKSIEKLKNYDLIFMDTAGRNYNNEMYISELNNILDKSSKSETFLVLSLTHKFEDMMSILEQFKKVNINKILFTKFDETLTYGAILNILTMFPYKTSYVTHGQNVPDDIEVFNEEKIARAILGV